MQAGRTEVGRSAPPRGWSQPTPIKANESGSFHDLEMRRSGGARTSLTARKPVFDTLLKHRRSDVGTWRMPQPALNVFMLKGQSVFGSSACALILTGD